MRAWLRALTGVLGISGAALALSARGRADDPSRPEREEEKAEPGDNPAEAVRYRRLSLVDEKGRIPPDAQMKAAGQVALMRRESARRGLNAGGIAPGFWSWLGPGNIGGRVRALAVHPTDANVMWVGGVAGGIWKTTNAGASWVPMDDFMANLAVTSIVVRPGDPNELYAATGEGFYNFDAIFGAGIFRSVDGGTNWTRLPATANDNFRMVNRLAISPAGVLLAATETGLHRSGNGGATWLRVHNVRTLDVDFHPLDGNRAIAGRSDGVALFSLDGGMIWSSAGTPAPPGANHRLEVAFAPGNVNTAYVSADYNGGQVWRSGDGGQSYSLVNEAANHLGIQGWYDNALWVDPVDENVIVIGGVDLWRSLDGGGTLTKISNWVLAPGSAHADHHVMAALPGYGTSHRTVVFGNDGGIYRADDVYTVATDSGWQALNNGLGITQFYGAAGHAGSGVVVGGTQDNGTLRYTGNPEAWSRAFGGDGGFCASDPTSSAYFYGEYQFMNLLRSSSSGSSFGSFGLGIVEPTGCKEFIAAFILDPNVSTTMLVGGCKLWRSTNIRGTGNFTSIKPSGAPARITAIAVARNQSNIIWVGDDTGGVYKTLDGTSAAPSWSRHDGPLPNRRVTRLAIDQDNPNVVYATFAGYSPDNVWRTADGGQSWQDRTGSGSTGLPDTPVRSLVRHPTNPSWIYAGTEAGVFVSENAGVSWWLPQDGPANVSVDELFLMGNDLVAATHGRGLYRTPLVGQARSISFTEAASWAEESAGSVTVTARIVTSNGLPTTSAASVAFNTMPGTARAVYDYTHTTGTLSFPQGTASGATRTAVITLLEDELNEDLERFSVVLSTPVGAGRGTPAIWTVTILDNDDLPTVYSLDQFLREKDVESVTMSFPVRLSTPSGRTVTAAFATVDGTATAPADYGAVSQTVVFTPGETEVVVPVTIQPDLLDEGDAQDKESFSVSVTPVTAAQGEGTWRGDIEDNDPLPVVGTIDNTMDPEGESGTKDLVYPVTLNVPSGREVRVHFVTAENNSARAGADYVSQSRPLVFPPGTTSRSWSVPIVGERVYEPGPNETFWVRLENAVHAVPGSPPREGGWQGAIVDDDLAPTVSVSDCAGVEPEANLQPCPFGVTLSNPSYQVVTVSYGTAATSPPGAQVGVDYHAASGQLTFPAETTELSQTAPVPLLPDGADEGNESFLLRLTGAAGGGATILNGEAVGTIIDNEPARFYPVPACRVLDTRLTGPPLRSGEERTFPVNTTCGVQPPPGAKAAVLNVTAVQHTGEGTLRVLPRGLPLSMTSVLNFGPAGARANNATTLIGAREQITVRNDMASPTGTTHVLIDIFGYYR